MEDIANSLNKGVGTDANIIDFSCAFDLVPLDLLFTKLVSKLYLEEHRPEY